MVKQFINKLKTQFQYYFGLNAVLFFKLIFGSYYDFSSSVILRRFAKAYCIFVIIAYWFVIYFIWTVNSKISLAFFLIVMTVDAAANILFSFITEEKYVIEFSSMVLFESGLNDRNIYFYLQIFHLVIVISSYLKRYYSIYAYAVAFVNISAYNNRIISFYVMNTFKDAVRSLRLSLSKHFKNKNLTSDQKLLQINKFLNAYMKLLRIIDKVFKIIRFKVSFCTICDIIFLPASNFLKCFVCPVLDCLCIDSRLLQNIRYIIPWISICISGKCYFALFIYLYAYR
ncbi:hypothetical protein B5X24_HaOG200975 [Helicoverpa armigera]|nr:hypothetical protein B5X24_HaOG200975 [Helicoverpa armigera]